MPREKKRRKKQPEEIILTPAEVFAQLTALKSATRCILGIEDEYKIYVRLTKDFAELGAKAETEPFEGSDQCAALSEECRKKAEELKPKLPTEKEEISRTVTTTMREKELRAGKKKGKGKWYVLAVTVLIIAAGVCYKAAPTRYLIAGLEKGLSLKKYAMESYFSLGDYKDSPEKAKEMMYEYASDLQEDGRWDEAWKFFHRLEKKQFRDSASRVLAVEQKMMAEAKAGETVYFGGRKWILLDKQDGMALLTRNETIRGKHSQEAPVAGEVYQPEAKKVTWENSSLRSYLNHDFIQKEFSVEEQKVIQMTGLGRADNPVYGTKGGKDTMDKVYIFSAEEIGKYAGIMKNKAKSLRLRNPGISQDSTAYYSHLKEVVYYGFPVDQKGVYNRPVLWARYEG